LHERCRDELQAGGELTASPNATPSGDCQPITSALPSVGVPLKDSAANRCTGICDNPWFAGRNYGLG
jgi:hypothetical protein